MLLPQRAWSRLVGSGQGAVRHITQWALPVWSTTQVWVPGHTTLEQDSAGKHRRPQLSLHGWGEPGTAVLLLRLLRPRGAAGIVPGTPGQLRPPPALSHRGTERRQGLEGPKLPHRHRSGGWEPAGTDVPGAFGHGSGRSLAARGGG